ncbi:TetR/AcrR family transcriptional regulator [Mycolicibacterium bacteremicum]|uniref:TetR family transcriptional regulator n=1 Tax=Mycolicibacterium bacteremicum TaxID=564198 RepID=A0A1W9Z3W8_MYCBA|nr:TetR/AcrR family transcriptional regulator [Mycolicibacterium bacteremicum]MCV7434002.1 TetR/AcrR family transcriptional regulator [Mycolicibacterium bacteremicum]ORA06994.1 TetR family transcriptional regulator [Mycolicibacterium bacteremicum]
MRRRGEQLDAAIRAAVIELLTEHGPAAVTMEAVAARAQTSKPVLYRRWADGRQLLRDTLLRTAKAAIPHRDTGSYRTDMLAVLRGWAELFTGPHGPTMQAAVAAMAGDAELTTSFREDVIGWRKAEMAALLARGIARGDVRADVPVQIARELGQSVLWHRLLVTGDPITDELVVQLVDEVLVPFVAPTTPRS